MPTIQGDTKVLHNAQCLAGIPNANLEFSATNVPQAIVPVLDVGGRGNLQICEQFEQLGVSVVTTSKPWLSQAVNIDGLYPLIDIDVYVYYGGFELEVAGAAAGYAVPIICNWAGGGGNPIPVGPEIEIRNTANCSYGFKFDMFLPPQWNAGFYITGGLGGAASIDLCWAAAILKKSY